MQTTSKMVTQACVVYRERDGEIVHIHYEFFAPGMELNTEEQMELLARRHASARQRNLTEVGFLHLHEPNFAGFPRRVDPNTGELELAGRLPTERPSRPSA
jgi:hypothetical protein